MQNPKEKVDYLEQLRLQLPGLELPDMDDQAQFWDDTGRLITVELEYDSGYSNIDPIADRGDTAMYSFNRRHINFLDLGEHVIDILDVPKALNKRFGARYWRQLGCFNHGSSLWFPAANGRPPGTGGDFRWDGTMFAGVWTVSEHLKEHLKGTRYQAQQMDRMVEGDCQEYTNWVNGDVYGYTVKVFNSGETTPAEEDACGGFLGDPETSGLLETVLEFLIGLGMSSVSTRLDVQRPTAQRCA